MSVIEKLSKVANIETHAATPAETSWANLRLNWSRPIPRMENSPDFNHKKSANEPIAIVGGGPSLHRTLPLLRQFPRIMAAGSVHDFLIENGVVPEWAVCCDPDPISRAYYQNPCKPVVYLLATQCEPALFEHLKDYYVAKWHCYPVDEEFLNTKEIGWHAVAGGCTVGLRCLSIAIMYGFSNIHFFGFDSCLGEKDAHHAYEYATDEEELGKVFEIRCGDDTFMTPEEIAAGPIFRCEGYQLAQAHHFKMFYREFNKLFTPTFHGGGMLAYWYDGVLRSVRRMENAA